MKINSFSFNSNSRNLNIEEVSFENLNLLVGASGVGKTRILKALNFICNVAQGKVQLLEDVKWSINFSHLDKNYHWSLEAEISNSIYDPFTSEPEQAEILDEKLIEFNNSNEIEILHRTSKVSKLNNRKLPKLKRTESAITILAEEDSIAPISEAFKRFIFNENPQSAIVSMKSAPSNVQTPEYLDLDDYEYRTYLQKLKEDLVDAPTLLKAYYLKSLFPRTFDAIKEIYIEIFTSVEDIKVVIESEAHDRYNLLFEIKENDSEKWISQFQISSGMYRALTYLVEIIAAPEESVIIIDEFENSLGINCMPQLTELILDKSPDLQFILTSHHPYIINNIPWKTWQLVSKNNGIIRSRKATDIPTLNTASSLDKFTQLINLLENEDIAA